MHVRMSVWGEPGEQLLTSLENWLHLEPELRTLPVSRLPATSENQEHKGPADHDDHLILALPDDRMPKVLASALSTWLSTRIGDIHLSVTGPDGTVEVSVANIADHEALLSAALGG
jgi:hypothetical protein